MARIWLVWAVGGFESAAEFEPPEDAAFASATVDLAQPVSKTATHAETPSSAKLVRLSVMAGALLPVLDSKTAEKSPHAAESFPFPTITGKDMTFRTGDSFTSIVSAESTAKSLDSSSETCN